MTRLGLIARAEDRGLGIQTWEFARHLEPSVLLIDMGKKDVHFNRYPGATRVRFTGTLPEPQVRRWLADVDAVYTAETTYTASFGRWARDANVDVYVHVNPEFHRDMHDASHWWAPTPWRLNHLPEGTTVVPVPVATERFTPVEPHDGPCRWLHVAGKPALADRNGTELVLKALHYVTKPCALTITTQSDRTFNIDNPLVDVTVVNGHTDYWSIYEGHDALVMPRRYGGLCLPVQEAMAAGMAVLMSDVHPNRDTWPVATTPAVSDRMERMPVGRVSVASVDPADLAEQMDRMHDPVVRRVWQRESVAWADAHSWQVWAPKYRQLMGKEVTV